jgi:broad specificity phosphatase PhoE
VVQARRIGDLLANEGVEAIYSSDLQRAFHTAQIIGKNLDLPVQVDIRLREVSLGEWEGMLVEEIMASFPRDWQARQEDPLYARPPGGESLLEVAERVWAAADQIIGRHPDGGVVIVSHGLSLASLLSRARGLSLAQAYDLIPENAHPMKMDLP